MKGKIKDVLTLSPMQRGIFYHVTHGEPSLAYFEQRAYRYDGEIDIASVEKSLLKLVDQHDVLSSVFVHKGLQEPVQVLVEGKKIEFNFIDLSARQNADAEVELLKEKDKVRGFNLEKDSLLRISILAVAPASYEIVWSFHHILLDGWSLGILNNQLWNYYQQVKAGKDPVISVIRRYSTYVQWLMQSDQTAAKTYWQNYLKGYDQIATIPGKKRPPSSKTFEKGEILLELGVHITWYLKQYASQHQFTISNIVQTLWGVLLSKYQMTRDVTFGTVVSGRPSAVPGIESMVGLFINTVPVRINWKDDTLTIHNLIKKTQTDFLAGEAYHYYPLSEIHADAAFGNNIFDHILVFENYPFEPDRKKGTKGKISIFTQSNYDLNVVVFPGENLAVKLNFNRCVYDKSLLEEVVAHLRELVVQLVDNKINHPSKFSLMSFAAQKALLSSTAAETRSYSSAAVLSLFNEIVEKHGHRRAVVSEELSYTYSELDAISGRLCRFMQESYELSAGQPVGVMMERSAGLLVSMLAVLKAGCIYVPIDPDLPQARKQFIIEDSGIGVILTETIHLIDLSAHFAGQMFFVDNQLGSLEEYDPSPVNPEVTNEAPVYAIYTSGSTGTPKGVLVNGSSLVNLCYWHREAFGLNEQSRATVYAGIGFDASVWEVWPYLLSGGTLYPITESQRLDLERLSRYMTEQEITHCFLPTPVCEQLGQMQEVTLPTNLVVLTGGDRLHEIELSQGRLINNYGPTEGTVVSTSIAVEEGRDGSTISIGRPITNTRAYVLDADRNLLPKGIVGELYIAGSHLSMGYLNNAELTAERFVPDPFGAPGTMMYATGDLCKWGGGDQLFFVGRKDNQVKIRGYRIELSEVENCLAAHEQISQAFVSVSESASGKFLIGYYHSAAPMAASLLKTYMSGTLPSYMVPSYFIHLAEIPMTANGKVDRKSFPSVDETLLVQGEYVLPRNEMEASLLAIWQEVLGQEQISVKANFFEAGGHSLKAVQMISRIYKKLDVKIDLNVIFQNPTIESLALEIASKETVDFMSIEPLPQQDHYAISHAQKRFWILDQSKKDHISYNMSEAYRLRGKLNINAFQMAFKALVDRHESLRSTISIIEGEPRQIIHPPRKQGFEVKYVDFRDLTDKEQQTRELALAEARFKFDLQTGPLLRAVLIHLASDEYVFVFTLHHIITDGWSMGVVLNDVLELYHAYDKGIAPRLKPLRIHYKEYAAWHNRQIQDAEVERLRSYWLNRFSDDIPQLNLPIDFERPRVKKDDGAMHTVALDHDATQLIRSWGLRHKHSLFITLTALVKALLHKYSGQEDIIIGTPIAGRDHIDLENQVGFFVNTLALRTRLDGSKSFEELQQRVKTTVLEAYEHQFYPFDLLINELNIPFELNRSPLFDVLMILQNMNMRGKGTAGIQGVELSKYESANPFSKFDLLFNFVEDDDRLVMSIVYDVNLFSAESISGWCDNFNNLCKVLLVENIPLTDISLLTSTEAEREHEEFLKSMSNI
ncbi:MAG: amino acid adenylation domain-containing protein [Bacteroidota bacterium]